MPELERAKVLTVTGGRLVGEGAPAVFHRISTDTRTLESGSLFVALSGERFDGHDFVGKAFAQGAAAALVTREVDAPGPLIVVEDTLEALGAIAGAHRNNFDLPVIAVTGSTGKTTTKEMIASILSQGWKTAKTPGNYNNEIGVPLALLELNSSSEAAVVELAMRGMGQIGYLARMVRPRIGVITNIGVSHIELLGTKEAIAEAKTELLDHLPSDGVAVLNREDDFFGLLSERSGCRVITFGNRPGVDVQADAPEVGPDGSVSFTLRGWWGNERIVLRAAGRHQALNATAAAAAAMTGGADASWIKPGLEAFEGADMRGRVIKAVGGFTVVDDCYNAAPDSMRVALELLVDLPGRQRWAILGDMKELGALTRDWHQEVGEQAAGMGVSGIVVLGELGMEIAAGARRATAKTEVLVADSNTTAAKLLLSRLSPGDIVLVKGSRAMKMEEIVERLISGKADG